MKYCAKSNCSYLKKHGLTVEFFGLPGSGKTTLSTMAAASLQKEGISCRDVFGELNKDKKPKRALLKTYLLIKQFFVSPFWSIKVMLEIMRTGQSTVRDFLKVTVNYFAVIYFLHNRRGENIFLDQGIFQAIWSIDLNARKHVRIEKIINKKYMPEIIISIDADSGEIIDRLTGRLVKQSRLEDKLSQDRAVAEGGCIYRSILEYLKRNDLKTVFIKNNSLDQLPGNIEKICAAVEEYFRARKLRVAHVITALTVGGAQENTVYCFKHHNRERFDVFLVAGGEKSFGGNNYLKQLGKSENVLLIEEMSNSAGLIKDIKALFKLYSFFVRERIDIVHTHSSKAGVLGRLAAKIAKTGMIIHTVHGWSFHNNMNRIRKSLYVWIERLAAYWCDLLITVTRLDIDKGLNERIGCREKYVIVRSGIDFSNFPSKEETDNNSLKKSLGNKKVIGTVGRFTRQKNPLDFLRIAVMITENHKDVHFLVVGDGPLRKEMEEFIGAHHLHDHVTLLGVRTDVNRIMQCFDVFLLTSLWEGLPRVILEAMGCRVPVVANCVDGVAEIIEHGVNGFLTKPHDLIGACGIIEKLLNSEELRIKVCNKAHLTIYPEYDIKRMLQQIEHLYENGINLLDG